MKTKRNGVTGIAVRNLFTVMVALLLVFGFNACSNGGGGGGPAGGPGGMDTDGDGFPDAWEEKYGYDPNDPSDPHKNGDPDEDGLTNWEEFLNGTDPHNADTDGDGHKDGWEVANGYNPLDANDPGKYLNLDTMEEFKPGEINTKSKGLIFYYSEEGFTMTDTGEVCHYLEVAAALPTNIYNSVVWFQSAQDKDVPGTGTAIGTGRKNSALMSAATERERVAASERWGYEVPLNYFATAAYFAPTQNQLETIYGGKTDWFLPSKDELNELYKFTHAGNFTGATANFEPTGCLLWSSSQTEANADFVYFQSFAGRLPGDSVQNTNVPFGFVGQKGKDAGTEWGISLKVRFIRAF